MQNRSIQFSLFFLLMIAASLSLTFGQTPASITWNLIGADSLAPTTTVGEITGKTAASSDSIAIIDQKSIPNSPISGVTEAVRWAPYAGGSKVSWGNETMPNENRWIQFAVAPNAGNAFVTDSISIYLGASGTSDHIKADLYYSSDPTFTNKTLLNPAEGVAPYRDSVQQFGYPVNTLINEGDTLYFRVYPWYDASPSTSKYLFTQYAQIFGNTVSPVISIDSASKVNEDVDTVVVTGVTISPNFQTSNRSYYIWDGTGGIVTFVSGLNSPALELGDSVIIVGTTHTYNGLLELNPLANSSVIVLDSNAVVPDPEVITLSEFLTNGEDYESHLIEVKGLVLASGTWPTSGSATLHLTDNVDTAVVYLDSDMKLFNSPEPTWPVDLIGIGSQFSSNGVGGYQILPRYITDFVTSGSVPVELVSFSAQVSEGKVILSWQTATETNNAGFEVQRSVDGKSFVKIGFINGHGTSVNINKYSYSDYAQNTSSYYRLKQVDFDGSYKYSQVVQVSSNLPAAFKLEQNYPNPFNPSTIISYDLPADSKVTLKVYDILGNEVSTLVNELQSAGNHKVSFDALSSSNHKQLSSGIYFYKLVTNNYTSIKKMMLLK